MRNFKKPAQSRGKKLEQAVKLCRWMKLVYDPSDAAYTYRALKRAGFYYNRRRCKWLMRETRYEGVKPTYYDNSPAARHQRQQLVQSTRTVEW